MCTPTATCVSLKRGDTTMKTEIKMTNTLFKLFEQIAADQLFIETLEVRGWDGKDAYDAGYRDAEKNLRRPNLKTQSDAVVALGLIVTDAFSMLPSNKDLPSFTDCFKPSMDFL